MAQESWIAPPRPVDYVEKALVTAILDGTYPADSTLPGERSLSSQLGITRPTLREVLRRLERDGWVTVQQGKATIVNDIWRDGGLTVLGTLVRYSDDLPEDFVVNLLQIRLDMAPSYTRAATANDPRKIARLFDLGRELPDIDAAFAAFDWRLHQQLTAASGNPIYTLILNGFAGFYEEMALRYFAASEARTLSRQYYTDAASAARSGELDQVETLTRQIMLRSIEQWRFIEQASQA